VARYPNHYYSGQASQRLLDPELVETTESAAVRAFLSSLPWPPRRPPESFEPAPAARARIERARLLSTAGLGDLCERELRFGASADGQPQILAFHLAQEAESPFRALHIMKSLVPDYISMPIESAPPSSGGLCSLCRTVPRSRCTPSS